MTKQESIEKLKELAFELPSLSDDEGYTDALRYAIETLEHCNLNEWCTDCKEYDHEKHSCPRFNRVIRHTAEEMQQTGRWIPCSERLPEVEDEMYLVTTGSWTVEIFWFSKDLYNADPEKFKDKKGESGWYYYDSTWGFLNCDDIIAWMPLPEPYEGEV